MYITLFNMSYIQDTLYLKHNQTDFNKHYSFNFVWFVQFLTDDVLGKEMSLF